MKYLFWVYAAFAFLPGSLCWEMAHGPYYQTLYLFMAAFWVVFFLVCLVMPFYIEKFI